MSSAKKIEAAISLVREAGYEYRTNNGGIHLIVWCPKSMLTADLWPTTQNWNIRDLNQRGHGVTTLIKELKTYDSN